jgi:hypothetical protein
MLATAQVRELAMTAMIVLAAFGVFGAGIIAGVIGVVSLAIHGRRNLTLTSEASNALTRGGALHEWSACS